VGGVEMIKWELIGCAWCFQNIGNACICHEEGHLLLHTDFTVVCPSFDKYKAMKEWR